MQPDTLISQLKKEHQEVRELFAKAEKAKPGERRAILKKIENELIPHARGEEKTVYAMTLERSSKTNETEAQDLVKEAYEEHRVVDRLLSDLKSQSTSAENWSAKLKVLKETVEHHIREEEDELFGQITNFFDEEELKNLLASYLETKKRYQESLPTQSQIDERSPSAEVRKAM